MHVCLILFFKKKSLNMFLTPSEVSKIFWNFMTISARSVCSLVSQPISFFMSEIIVLFLGLRLSQCRVREQQHLTVGRRQLHWSSGPWRLRSSARLALCSFAVLAGPYHLALPLAVGLWEVLPMRCDACSTDKPRPLGDDCAVSAWLTAVPPRQHSLLALEKKVTVSS